LTGTAYVGLTVPLAPTNIDMLSWFAEEERDACGSCGERASVTVQDALASFCLACGAITLDGIRIDLERQLLV
jgi:hypothetical protein